MGNGKGKDWFDTGYNGLDEAMDKEKGKFQPRFWLKEGEKRMIVFLESEPLCFYEHHLYANGSWGNYFTCLRQGCPLCKIGNKPYYVGMITIQDLTPYTDKNGVEHATGSKRIFAAKSRTLKWLRDQQEKRGSLKGLKYEAYRADEKTARVGGSFDFEGKFDIATLKDVEPFDFMKMFKPLEAFEVERDMAALGVGEGDPWDKEGKGSGDAGAGDSGQVDY